jgi:hypothetical protein
VCFLQSAAFCQSVQSKLRRVAAEKGIANYTSTSVAALLGIAVQAKLRQAFPIYCSENFQKSEVVKRR